MFCPFSREKNWHKLRKIYWACRQVVTVRLVNHNMELPDVNINTVACKALILRFSIYLHFLIFLSSREGRGGSRRRAEVEQYQMASQNKYHKDNHDIWSLHVLLLVQQGQNCLWPDQLQDMPYWKLLQALRLWSSLICFVFACFVLQMIHSVTPCLSVKVVHMHMIVTVTGICPKMRSLIMTRRMTRCFRWHYKII